MEFPMEWVCETPGESDKQVAEAVIPALKDKSIERDFRTLKRDRLVADIPMWDSCFFCSKGSDRQGRCRLRIAAGNDSRLSE